jgi:hypothetical protein
MKPSTLLFGALSVACAAPVAPYENAINPSSFAGFDLSQARHALYLEGQEDYDADGDGALDSTIKYLQFMVSDHPDLCREMQEGGYLYDLRMGYATAAYFGPLGSDLPDLRAEDVFVGDYYDGVWVDHGLTIIAGGRYAVSTGGYGEGSVRIEEINDIGEPFLDPRWINDIGEPHLQRTLRHEAPGGSLWTDAINDIGEPSLDLSAINDIGEPLRGIALGEMRYDNSGAAGFDLDLDGDGLKDATQLSPTSVQLNIRSAARCDLREN